MAPPDTRTLASHGSQLATISACVGGTMMFIYSGLLIITNRRMLPKEIRIHGFRLVALIWAIVLFGVLAFLTIQQQSGILFDALSG